MRTLAVAAMFTLLQCNAMAQPASGYYMVPSSSLTDEQNSYLESKIKQNLAASGVSSVDGYYPMVTVGRYMEIEVKTYEGGMRNMYQVSGDITVSIEFDGASAVLASTTVSVQGSGYTKEVARATAIRSFKLPKEKVEEMFATASKRAVSMLDAFAQKKIREITGFLAKRECYEAADMLSEVPSGTKYEPEIMKLAKQSADCVEKQYKEEMKRQDKLEDRKFQLDSMKLTAEERIERIRQNGYTQRAEIDSRNRAKERYVVFIR